MPNRIAIKVTLTCYVPISDASPEAYAEGAKALRSWIIHGSMIGIKDIEARTKIGNVRVVEPEPTGGQSGGAPTDGKGDVAGAGEGGADAAAQKVLDAADEAIAELGKRGEFGPIPGHTARRTGKGTLHLPT